MDGRGGGWGKVEQVADVTRDFQAGRAERDGERKA